MKLKNPLFFGTLLYCLILSGCNSSSTTGSTELAAANTCGTDLLLGDSASVENAACWSKNLIVKDSSATTTLNVANIPGTQISTTKAQVTLPKITSIKQATAQASNLFAHTIAWQQSTQLKVSSSYCFRICPFYSTNIKPASDYCNASSWNCIDTPKDGKSTLQGPNKSGQFTVQLGYSATAPEGSISGLKFTLEVVPVYAETKTNGHASKIPALLKAQSATDITYTFIVGDSVAASNILSNFSSSASLSSAFTASTTVNGITTVGPVPGFNASQFVAAIQAAIATTRVPGASFALGGNLPPTTIPGSVLSPPVVSKPVSTPAPVVIYQHSQWVDSDYSILIADTSNHVIRKVSGSDGKISTLAGTGTAGAGTDDILATQSALNSPLSVALDSVGNIYISDSGNHKIRKIDKITNLISTVAGIDSYGYSGDGGLATAASLCYPAGIFLDNSDDLYVADTGCHRIRKIDHATHVITTVAGGGSDESDSVLATSAQLFYPSSVVVDSIGNLYITNLLALGNFGTNVRKVTKSTGFISTIAGSRIWGSGYATGLAINAGFSAVSGLAFDSEENLYIGDIFDHTIRRFQKSDQSISTIAGIFSSAGFSGDASLATAAQLNQPGAVDIDASGNIYIFDRANFVVRKIDASTHVISTVAGTASINGYTGDDDQATNATLSGPSLIEWYFN